MYLERWLALPSFKVFKSNITEQQIERNQFFIVYYYNFDRPLHSFHRHLGCGAVAVKIKANVWKILQLLTVITP